MDQKDTKVENISSRWETDSPTFVVLKCICAGPSLCYVVSWDALVPVYFCLNDTHGTHLQT